MAPRECPYNTRRHIGSAANTQMNELLRKQKTLYANAPIQVHAHVTYVTARVQNIAKVQQKVPKIVFDFELKIEPALARNCRTKLQFKKFPELLDLLELNVQMSWVPAVHVHKRFEHCKEPRNVSISNLEVATYVLHLNVVQQYFRPIILIVAIVFWNRMIIPRTASSFHDPTICFNTHTNRLNHMCRMQNQVEQRRRKNASSLGRAIRCFWIAGIKATVQAIIFSRHHDGMKFHIARYTNRSNQ